MSPGSHQACASVCVDACCTAWGAATFGPLHSQQAAVSAGLYEAVQEQSSLPSLSKFERGLLSMQALPRARAVPHEASHQSVTAALCPNNRGVLSQDVQAAGRAQRAAEPG